MKKIMIRLIKLYQSIPFSSHGACKFTPTCSNYAIECYQKYSFIKGTILIIKRIIRCNPFNKGGFDPVPERK
jgi:hypothetical protein